MSMARAVSHVPIDQCLVMIVVTPDEVCDAFGVAAAVSETDTISMPPLRHAEG